MTHCEERSIKDLTPPPHEERAGYYLMAWPALREKWKKAGAIETAFDDKHFLGRWRNMVQELYEIKLKL